MRDAPRAVLLLLLLCACARAQEAAAPAAKPADLWLARASSLTDDLAKDAAGLDEFERALLWARLGGAWWTDDETRARAWLRKAVESVETGPESESAAARARRFDTARRLLPLIAPRDKESGKRLAALLTRTAAEKTAGESEGDGNAEALAEAAAAALDTDPPLALALAIDSLRAGTSFRLVDLSFSLRRRDPKLADMLFAEGLVRARARADADLLELLSGIGFPAQTNPGAIPLDFPAPPAAARARLLALVAERLLQPALTRAEEERACHYAWNVAQLLGEFTRLLPAQSGAVHAAVRRCQSSFQSPVARQHMEDRLNPQDLTTAEGLLRAAAAAQDETLKFTYRTKAAAHFNAEGKPERALEVLDSFTPSQYERRQRDLDNWRWGFAAGASLKRLREGDLYAARKLMDSLPPALRGYALLHLLQAMSGATEGKAIPVEMRRAVALEYVGETRRLLARSDAPVIPYMGLIALVRISAEYAPADAPEVLRDAVAASNRDKLPMLTPDGQIISSTEENSLQPQELPAALLEADETATMQALASVAWPGRRARLRLGLLASALEERRRAPKKPRRAKDAAALNEREARP